MVSSSRAIRLSSFLVAIAVAAACGGTGSTNDENGAGAAGTDGGGGTDGTSGAAGDGAGGDSGNAGSGQPGGMSGGGGSDAGAAGAGGMGTPCDAGTVTCDGNTKKVCDGKGGFSEVLDCPVKCTVGSGCTVCTGGVATCDGAVLKVCKDDGSAEVTTMCDPALGCSNGKCVSPCEAKGGPRSYIGCDYYPTVTSNHELFGGFSFAAVVANTTTSDATVNITRKGMSVASGVVKAGQLSTFKLPWVDELRHTTFTFLLPSALVVGGAYHLTSDQPVTVYQFNPLEYEVPQTPGCIDPGFTGKCYSYTNDASLLLPVSALGTEYIVAAYPSAGAKSDMGTPGDLPALLAITATEAGTTVTVKSTAHARGGNGVTKIAAGSTQTFKMAAGDVLQLITDTPTEAALSSCVPNPQTGGQYCKVSPEYDFTGTQISANKPISVIGGHDCAFSPYDTPACDHLEEMNFPLSTWGKSVLIGAPQSVKGATANDGQPDPHFLRVISGADGNQISIDPPIPGFMPPTLAKGKYVDLPQTTADVQIKGTAPILVTQVMAGGDLVDPNAGTKSRGDPSLSLGVPTEQFRKDYTFLAPASYSSSFVNVIMPEGAVVTLDGAPLGGPAPKAIGGSGYVVVRRAITGAAHTLKGDKPFGIVVYGYGNYTSYMVPGGLNLEAL